MKLGIFADPHYSTADQIKTRRPSRSMEKVHQLAGIFKREEAEAIVCLGDLINSEKDAGKDRQNLRDIAQVLRFAGLPVFCVMGNHDAQAFTPTEYAAISGFRTAPYTADFGDTRLIFLDCCYTDNGTPEGLPYRDRQFHWKNAYLPASQLEFLEQAAAGVARAVVFTHQNLDDRDNPHCIRNVAAARAVIERCGNIRTVFSGHYHPGGQFTINGVTYVTPPALCELDQLPYILFEL